MKKRTIESVIAPREPHFVGDGFRVHNFIPSALTMQRMSPFIMMDYNSKFIFPASKIPKGVGVHPHRGFETVTIAYKGKVAHGDSSGNSGIIGEGDVQWMTAASGILHKEHHEEEFSKTGGEFQMVQLWVNLPAKDKMSTPKYQGITKDQISKYMIPNEGGTVEVIAGEHKNVKGAASTFTPVNLFNVRLNKGAKEDFSFPVTYNSAVLVVEGSITVNGETVIPTDHLGLLANDGENFTIEASENAVVLIVGGEPINEPIATYGPFVMNTKAEIVQAVEDFNMGKFGYLED